MEKDYVIVNVQLRGLEAHLTCNEKEPTPRPLAVPPPSPIYIPLSLIDYKELGEPTIGKTLKVRLLVEGAST